MDRAILVLNSGSSSLKFALCRDAGEALSLVSQGEIDAMMTKPRFRARRVDGIEVEEKSWKTAIDAETGFRFVLGWVEKTCDTIRVVAAGHRLVQGCARYHGPTLVDDEALAYLDALSMLEP